MVKKWLPDDSPKKEAIMPDGSDDDFTWEIEDADPDPSIETEYGGKIEIKRLPSGSERRYVTKFLLFFLCGIIIISLMWGAYSEDYTPFEKTKEITTFVFGCLLGHYYTRAR